ncbi:PRD domain-containing protein [Allocoprobacillus halotolerans]|uniref:PRD domain-containing protein n=1 Tax=Allocoprobacillus halotolerans TaxID=2944914 RepID=A0ABY5I7G7_9FIRM|nr:PRD domain-containing protein [Allocoprobacillus halotolerans]UTY40319.1 PRD domain-containing protein [Allocoprobacillus halotolerans]
MKAIKKLNNNVVVCVDGKGRELIAMGKGLGFQSLPREVSLSEIERTFYDFEVSEQNILKDLPADVVLFTASLMDIIKNELPYDLSSNATLVMADHIAFAIERAKQNIVVKMPLLYEVQQMYPLEYKIGKYALKKIKREFEIDLPNDEITGIALNLINSRLKVKDTANKATGLEYEDMLNEVTEIIEQTQRIIIDKDSFDYSRYATHLLYLFQRIRNNKTINSANYILYKDLVDKFPSIEICVSKICHHIEEKWKVQLSEDEKLYLMLHVNRICVRKDCNLQYRA